MILDLEIGPAKDDELNFVRDSWMRNSKWRRESMLAALDKGQVYVARDGSFIVGWIAVSRGALAMGFVREKFRSVGVFRSLWERAGRPEKVLSPAARGAHAVMRRLLASRKRQETDESVRHRF